MNVGIGVRPRSFISGNICFKFSERCSGRCSGTQIGGLELVVEGVDAGQEKLNGVGVWQKGKKKEVEDEKAGIGKSKREGIEEEGGMGRKEKRRG